MWLVYTSSPDASSDGTADNMMKEWMVMEHQKFPREDPQKEPCSSRLPRCAMQRLLLDEWPAGAPFIARR